MIDEKFGYVLYIMVEFGCGMVVEVGIIVIEVLFVLCKFDCDMYCWVYLLIGCFFGLVEIEGEVICYCLDILCDVDVMGLCIIVGLFCDSVDVFYEKCFMNLFLLFEVGDCVLICNIGVYILIYSLVGFNGFLFL